MKSSVTEVKVVHHQHLSLLLLHVYVQRSNHDYFPAIKDIVRNISKLTCLKFNTEISNLKLMEHFIWQPVALTSGQTWLNITFIKIKLGLH